MVVGFDGRMDRATYEAFLESLEAVGLGVQVENVYLERLFNLIKLRLFC